MSYNTRRQQTGYGPPQNASNIGQRRPNPNNFVPGGQQMPNQLPRTPNPQQKPPQGGMNPRNQGNYQNTPQKPQAPPPNQQQAVKQNPNATPAKPAAATPTPAKPPVAPTTPAVAQVPPPAPAPPVISEDVEDNTDTSLGPKRKFWPKTKANKISRAEKVRRRNMRLSKLLQPKNAVMILNELVKGCVYQTDELPVKLDSNQFRATVSFDGLEFAGTGRTKIAAKNTAAEVALKHLVKNKQLITTKKEDEDGDEKMELEGDMEGVMPWSHIASFAMYKLFSTWGEDPNICTKIDQPAAPTPAAREVRPARKMPDNPETVNPMMLMHQMLPQSVWQEVGKSGNPPNVVFTFDVTVDGKTFRGVGNSKKTAKKLAAFAACHEILNITYPPDVWTPLY